MTCTTLSQDGQLSDLIMAKCRYLNDYDSYLDVIWLSTLLRCHWVFAYRFLTSVTEFLHKSGIVSVCQWGIYIE